MTTPPSPILLSTSKPQHLSPLGQDEWSSPAFVKRARLSYGSLFEDGFDLFAEADGTIPGKGRKRIKVRRSSARWRLASQSRSPSPEFVSSENEVTEEHSKISATIRRPAMADEASQTVGLDTGMATGNSVEPAEQSFVTNLSIDAESGTHELSTGTQTMAFTSTPPDYALREEQTGRGTDNGIDTSMAMIPSGLFSGARQPTITSFDDSGERSAPNEGEAYSTTGISTYGGGVLPHVPHWTNNTFGGADAIMAAFHGQMPTAVFDAQPGVQWQTVSAGVTEHDDDTSPVKVDSHADPCSDSEQLAIYNDYPPEPIDQSVLQSTSTEREAVEGSWLSTHGNPAYGGLGVSTTDMRPAIDAAQTFFPSQVPPMTQSHIRQSQIVEMSHNEEDARGREKIIRRPATVEEESGNVERYSTEESSENPEPYGEEEIGEEEDEEDEENESEDDQERHDARNHVLHENYFEEDEEEYSQEEEDYDESMVGAQDSLSALRRKLAPNGDQVNDYSSEEDEYDTDILTPEGHTRSPSGAPQQTEPIIIDLISDSEPEPEPKLESEPEPEPELEPESQAESQSEPGSESESESESEPVPEEDNESEDESDNENEGVLIQHGLPATSRHASTHSQHSLVNASIVIEEGEDASDDGEDSSEGSDAQKIERDVHLRYEGEDFSTDAETYSSNDGRPTPVSSVRVEEESNTPKQANSSVVMAQLELIRNHDQLLTTPAPSVNDREDIIEKESEDEPKDKERHEDFEAVTEREMLGDLAIAATAGVTPLGRKDQHSETLFTQYTPQQGSSNVHILRDGTEYVDSPSGDQVRVSTEQDIPNVHILRDGTEYIDPVNIELPALTTIDADAQPDEGGISTEVRMADDVDSISSLSASISTPTARDTTPADVEESDTSRRVQALIGAAEDNETEQIVKLAIPSKIIHAQRSAGETQPSQTGNGQKSSESATVHLTHEDPPMPADVPRTHTIPMAVFGGDGANEGDTKVLRAAESIHTRFQSSLTKELETVRETVREEDLEQALPFPTNQFTSRLQDGKQLLPPSSQVEVMQPFNVEEVAKGAEPIANAARIMQTIELPENITTTTSTPPSTPRQPGAPPNYSSTWQTVSTPSRMVTRTTRSVSLVLDQSVSPGGYDASADLALSMLESPVESEAHDANAQLALSLLEAPSDTTVSHQPLPPDTSVVHDTRLRSKLAKPLKTESAIFTPLKLLRLNLGRKIDVLAIATMSSSEPVRALKGLKHFNIRFAITDVSIAPGSVVEVQVYRPFKNALPVLQVGDGVLLRNFLVRSEKGKGFTLRSELNEGSSWAVFGAKAETINGPPVEFSDEERAHVDELKEWFSDLDTPAKVRLEKANDAKIAGASKGPRKLT